MSSAFGARATAVIAVLLTPSSAMAQASAPADQRPKWAVQIAPGECTLLHTTGGSDPSLFRLKTDVGTETYFLSLAGSEVRAVAPVMIQPVEVRIDGKVKARRYGSPSRRPELGFDRLFHVTSVPRPAIDAAAAGETLEVRSPAGTIATIEVARGAKAFGAFRACEADQLVEWGADPEQFQPGGTTPVIKDRDRLLPQAQLNRIKYSGVLPHTEHYLVISAGGVVEKCSAVHELPGSDMEQVVCTYLAGRRIGEPARAPSGKAVRGVITIQPPPASWTGERL